MKAYRMLLLLVFCLLVNHAFSQTIVQSIPLSNTTYWNQAWGLAADSTRLYISSGTSTTTVYNYGFIYKTNHQGIPVDSINPGVGYSQGLAYDGTHFYYVRRYTSACTIYKLTGSGAIVDSLRWPSNRYLGGATWDGSHLWVSDYTSTNPGIPAYLYKIDWTTKTLVDSIQTIGLQPQGIAWDGQYLYYAMDLNSSEPNQSLIYVVNPATRDTVRTIPMPEPPNVDCNPRGLAWDGAYLWLIAEPVGASSGRVLYKYDLGGSGTPAINVPIRFFDYGRIRIGNTQQAIATIQNIGTGDLRIDSVRVLYSNQFTTNLTTPLIIPAGSSSNFMITFAPTTYGVDSAHVVLFHNDPARQPQVIRNVAMGIYPTSYIFTSSTHAWGTRRVNSTNLWTLTIENRGALPFIIDSIAFGNLQFYIEPGTLPFTVDSVNSRSLRVWFRPSAAGSAADTMKIYSSAANAPVVPIYLTGTGDSTSFPLGGILWEGAVPDYRTFPEPIVRSLKTIPDVTNDGYDDVIVASDNYLIMCFNGGSSVTGDVLWTFNTGTNNQNSGSVFAEEVLQVRDDVDGDGAADVVFGCGGGNESVYTLSGRTGRLIWYWGDSTNPGLGDIMGIRVDRDYNGDGVKDVLVSASGSNNFTGRHSVICLNGLNGQEIFNRQLAYNFTYDITSTQVGGAIGVGNEGGPYAILGFDTLGLPMWSHALAGTLNAAWALREVPDISGDNLTDVVSLYGFSGNVVALDAVSGTPLWTANLGSSNLGKVLVLDDLNENGYADLTAWGPVAFHRFDSYSGNILWSAYLNSSYTRGAAFLSDVNGDRYQDIAVVTQQPAKLFVLNGTNGNVLFEYLFGAGISARGDQVAALRSIDGDLSTEMVAGNREGRIVCFAGGQNTVVGVKAPTSTLPKDFSVSQNYPNPFNPSTTIEVRLPVQSDFTVRIFDVLGREVRSFHQDRATAGVHKIIWDGKNHHGAAVSTGVYFYQVRMGENFAVRRMMVLK